MDTFNSALLTHQDAYYHGFSTVGTYTWGVAQKQGYTINVVARPAGVQPVNRLIDIPYSNGTYAVGAADQQIQINAGDMVCWHVATLDPAIPPLFIVGDNGAAQPVTFGNGSLGGDDAFTHMFLTQGTYTYAASGGIPGGPKTGSIPVAPYVAPSQQGPGTGAAQIIAVTLDRNGALNPDPPTRANNASVVAGDVVNWQIDGANTKVIIRSQ